MKPLRHTAKIRTTDTRCIVVMMQIPGREDHALIVETDSLPDHYHQAVIDAVESPEGQADDIFANTLSRKMMGSGITILQALHQDKKLRAIHVDQVMMTPQPNLVFPLRKVLESMGKQIPGDVSVMDPEHTKRFNPHTHNQNTAANETQNSIALGYIKQAQFLEADANALREKAYQMVPTLRPTTTPGVSAEEATRNVVESVVTDEKAINDVTAPVQTVATKTPAKRPAASRAKTGNKNSPAKK